MLLRAKRKEFVRKGHPSINEIKVHSAFVRKNEQLHRSNSNILPKQEFHPSGNIPMHIPHSTLFHSAARCWSFGWGRMGRRIFISISIIIISEKFATVQNSQ
jgi:hypothetical protein